MENLFVRNKYNLLALKFTDLHVGTIDVMSEGLHNVEVI